MVVCPVTFSFISIFRFPMVVSNLFLWYDEGQDLFSERKNLQFLFQNVSKKKKNRNKMEGRNIEKIQRFMLIL